MSEAQVTSGSEFRRLNKEGQIRTLKASGRVVRQRPVNLFRLLKSGKIPDPLTPYVVSLVWSDSKEEDKRSEQLQAVEWADYLDLIAVASLVDPVIVDDPQADNEIGLDDLTWDELLEIHTYARKPFDDVQPFRAQQNGDVGTGDEGGESVKAAKRVRAGTGG